MSVYGRSIPEFVKRFREDCGLTQRQLGDMMGVHSQYISNVERESHENPVEFCVRLVPFVDKARTNHLISLMEDATNNRILSRLKIKRRRYSR